MNLNKCPLQHDFKYFICMFHTQNKWCTNPYFIISTTTQVPSVEILEGHLKKTWILILQVWYVLTIRRAMPLSSQFMFLESKELQFFSLSFKDYYCISLYVSFVVIKYGLCLNVVLVLDGLNVRHSYQIIFLYCVCSLKVEAYVRFLCNESK